MKSKSFLSILLMIGVAGISLTADGRRKTPGEYDRLDGRGKSGIKVHVIEWQGNLELHVYPHGSTVSLAMKLDKRNKSKPVMVIGYRFKSNPKKQLIRRAILGIPMNEGFKVYRVKSEREYDKFMISNQPLTGGSMELVTLEPGPKQLYPDGHPALLAKEDQKEAPQPDLSPDAQSNRFPTQSPTPASATRNGQSPAANSAVQKDGNSGNIKSFSW